MAGRPSYYETPEKLEEAIEKYFSGESQLTITGLALELGFCDRQSLYDYEEKPEFSCIIKKARLRVENSYEKKLHSAAWPTAGMIFALKNMGWKDRSEVDATISGSFILNETRSYDSDQKADKGT